jgi:8-oxo-dGTP pyrophosphatase MutT (NUDIX family)
MVNPAYRNEIRRELAAYLQRFPEDSQFLGFLPQQLEQGDLQICSRKNFSGHLTASALLVDAAGTNTFLIHHNFLGRWLQAGGHLDPLELPRMGAARELMEETGITNFKLHDWHVEHKTAIDIDSHFIPRNPAKREFSHYHHDFLYVFILNLPNKKQDLQKANYHLQAEEVGAAKWVALHSLNEAEFGKRLVRAAKKFLALTAV